MVAASVKLLTARSKAVVLEAGNWYPASGFERNFLGDVEWHWKTQGPSLPD